MCIRKDETIKTLTSVFDPESSVQTQMLCKDVWFELQSDFFSTPYTCTLCIIKCNSTETRASLSKYSPMKHEAIGL
jgi:hypothetical protein